MYLVAKYKFKKGSRDHNTKYGKSSYIAKELLATTLQAALATIVSDHTNVNPAG